MKRIFNQFVFYAIFAVFLSPFTVSGQDASTIMQKALDEIEKMGDSPVSGTAAPSISSGNVSVSVIDNLEVQNMDIGEVLKIVAQKSGLKIIGQESIQGKITLFLHNVNVYDVLRIILDANQLAYVEEEGFIKIMKAEEYQDRYGYPFGREIQTRIVPLAFAKFQDIAPILEQIKSPGGQIFPNNESGSSIVLMDTPQKVESMTKLIKELDVSIETEVFSLVNIRAVDLVPAIQEKLTKNIGQVQFDDQAGTITVTDTTANLRLIEKLVEESDQEKKEILLETKIIQVVLDDEYRTGVDWEAIVSDYQQVPYAEQKTAAGHGSLSVGTITEEDFAVLQEALDTVGVINTMLNSKIMSANDRALELTTQAMQSTIPLDEDQNKFVDSQHPAKFYLTPHKNENNEFQLHIVPDENTLQVDWDALPAHLNGANERPREIVINVHESSTAVIGGLFRDVTVESTRKIPLLGDLPLVGFAFRNDRQVLKNSEIIIFITPKLMAN